VCGCIVTTYDKRPYVHMLTAEKMLSDVAAVAKTSPVRVATEEDIRDLSVFEMAVASERLAEDGSASARGKRTMTGSAPSPVSPPRTQLEPNNPYRSSLASQSSRNPWRSSSQPDEIQPVIPSGQYPGAPGLRPP